LPIGKGGVSRKAAVRKITCGVIVVVVVVGINNAAGVGIYGVA